MAVSSPEVDGALDLPLLEMVRKARQRLLKGK
jgi:hypothetical protein